MFNNVTSKIPGLSLFSGEETDVPGPRSPRSRQPSGANSDMEPRLLLTTDIGPKKQLPDDVAMVTVLQPDDMLDTEKSLHSAAKDNDVEKIKSLLANKLDVNARNNLDRTALHLAASNGNLDIVRALMMTGANLELQDKYGMRPVQWAAWFGHVEAVKVLVEAGANTSSCNKQGLNLLHCAAQNNHIPVVKYILENLTDFRINDGEKSEKSALHLAAENGSLEVVNMLIQVKCAYARDKDGQTALHSAAAQGHANIVEKLLAEGLVAEERDLDDQTPLHVAAAKGHAKVIEILIDAGVDINPETLKKNTALHLAAMYGHKDAVAILLKSKVLVDLQNQQGNTALHLASSGNFPDVVQLLIDAHCELNLPNNRLMTALHIAVENGFADVVEVLLVAGADAEPRDKLGKTALYLASRGSFITVVDMLIKADRHKEQVTHDRREAFLSNGIDHDNVDIKLSSVPNALDSVDSKQLEVQFKRIDHPYAQQMKSICWKLATKQLKPNDWKKLALRWNFSENHVRAIEHQHTGPNSYKEHGYRLLLIWLHGVKKKDHPMKSLFEALSGIGRHDLAEHVRKKGNVMAGQAPPSTSPCSKCVIS